MVDEGIFATTAQIQAKAGSGASSVAKAEAYTNVYIAEAESYINSTTRHNWSDDYAGLNTDVKYLLREAASNIAAMYVIQFDMSGYTSLQEAQTMLSVLWDRTLKCIDLLKDWKVKDFKSGA
jgi:hypothetical protein